MVDYLSVPADYNNNWKSDGINQTLDGGEMTYLQMIEYMDLEMYKKIRTDVTDENDPKLLVMIEHRWPHLMRFCTGVYNPLIKSDNLEVDV